MQTRNPHPVGDLDHTGCAHPPSQPARAVCRGIHLAALEPAHEPLWVLRDIGLAAAGRAVWQTWHIECGTCTACWDPAAGRWRLPAWRGDRISGPDWSAFTLRPAGRATAAGPL